MAISSLKNSDDCEEDIKDYLAQKNERAEIDAENHAAHFLRGASRAEAFNRVADRYLDLSRRFYISAEQFSLFSRKINAECMGLYCKSQGELCRARAKRAEEEADENSQKSE